jgi:uncharacterized phage infection (PIP) family protein YhgE
MDAESKSRVNSALKNAEQRILTLLGNSENEIRALANEFEDLAHQTNNVLLLAAAIVESVEGEGVRSMLPKVQALGAAAKLFIHERLQATVGIVETATAESKMLERLTQLTRGQRSIARETQTLSVLTSIEVARLGQLGAGFQYLAHELDDFSQSVTTSTKELSSSTDMRRSSVEETRRRLATGLPKIQKEFARLEVDLGNALQVVSSSHIDLTRAPEQFQACVEEIAGQIAGVVGAVQSHDITRQQLEHVREALTAILEKTCGDDDVETEAELDIPLILDGIAIQIYQLKSTEGTVEAWLSQIGMCIDNILRISSSDLAEIGPMVLQQDREISSQLARIELLETECEKDNDEVRETIAGISSLMQLVGEHVEKSKDVRDRLQLLTFNSIVESSRLGKKADAILEISQSIKRISVDWSALTDRSAQAKDEILSFVDQAGEGMRAFSNDGNVGLRAAQEETRVGLESLRAVAAFTAEKVTEVEEATERLKAKIAAVSASKARLANNFAGISALSEELEAVRLLLQSCYPDGLQRTDRAAVEAYYSESYTTEIEREVMRAALSGGPLPIAQQNVARNDVELF